MGCSCSCSKKKGNGKNEIAQPRDSDDVDVILPIKASSSSVAASEGAFIEEDIILDANHNAPVFENSGSLPASTPTSLREDIACQTTEPLPPHIVSDGKLINGYYPKFSPIHADFLKAKSLEVFLQENNIPLSDGALLAMAESAASITGSKSSALEIIREESDRSGQNASREEKSGGSIENKKDSESDDKFHHIDSENEDDDDDAKTLNSNLTMSQESIGTAFYSLSRASSYQTSLDYLSSEWNISDALRKQIFIADI